MSGASWTALLVTAMVIIVACVYAGLYVVLSSW